MYAPARSHWSFTIAFRDEHSFVQLTTIVAYEYGLLDCGSMQTKQHLYPQFISALALVSERIAVCTLLHWSAVNYIMCWV